MTTPMMQQYRDAKAKHLLTPLLSPLKIRFMTTKEKNLIPPGLLAELKEVMADLAKGKRDPEAMKKAARDMDRMREETRRKLGTLDVAVELIREGRDEI